MRVRFSCAWCGPVMVDVEPMQPGDDPLDLQWIHEQRDAETHTYIVGIRRAYFEATHLRQSSA
jgi:hypothetical protein